MAEHDALTRAPAAYDRSAWTDAFDALSVADEAGGLVPRAIQALDDGDPATALELYEQVATTARRFDDAAGSRSRR